MLSITHLEMLSLETKQSGDKLLPHSDLRGGGVFLEEVSRSRKGKFLDQLQSLLLASQEGLCSME
jgi:hypothetical protein